VDEHNNNQKQNVDLVDSQIDVQHENVERLDGQVPPFLRMCECLEIGPGIFFFDMDVSFSNQY
jgi:hypothetical protein